MSKFYEVRCTASAEITELWRVQADSEDQAIELIGEGQGDFIRQCDDDEERDRRDWQADEILPYEYETLGQWDQMQAAAPDMLAALEDAYSELLADSHRDGPRCLLLTQMERAIAKAKGQGA
jgi:hypothetical protein